MSIVAHLLRFALVLVLWAGPLVASVQAAEDGVWSSVWASPLDGTVPPAEEEAPEHAEPEAAKEEALLSRAGSTHLSAEACRHAEADDVPPEAPYDGAPTPPPDAC